MTMAQDMWRRTTLSDEYAELQRVAAEEQLPLDFLVLAFRAGTVVQLTEAEWQRLENTESADPQLTITQALAYAHTYGRDLPPLIRALMAQRPVPMPVVAARGSRLFCVGGNTRLMAARVLRLMPEVLWLQL